MSRWLAMRARPFSLSSLIVVLFNVFRRLNELNDLSLSQDVTGNVHIIVNILCTLGNCSLLHNVRADFKEIGSFAAISPS